MHELNVELFFLNIEIVSCGSACSIICVYVRFYFVADTFVACILNVSASKWR